MQKMIWFLVVCFLLIFSSGIAHAATYVIAIRPVNSTAEAKISVCNEVEICFLTLELPAGSQNYVDVAVRIQDGAAAFQFMRNRAYLATNPSGKNRLEFQIEELPKKQIIKLYKPHSQIDDDQIDSLHSLPVMRVSTNIIAELEIEVNQE